MTIDKTPTDAEPRIPHTCAGFIGAHISQHGNAPSQQEVWNAAIRSYRNLQGSPVVAGEPTVKYVPVKADLRDKHWNHPRDDEPRTEACRKALRDRGDDEGQGLDGYWKWGFAAGFNAALATTPQPTQAQAGAVPLTDEQIGSLACVDGLTNIEVPALQWLVREVEYLHGIKEGGQHADR